MDSSCENVYDVSNSINKPTNIGKTTNTNSRSSKTLPRSSGSLPASTLSKKLNRSPLKLLRRERSSSKMDLAVYSDIPSNFDLYQTVDESAQNITEKGAVYCDIGKSTENSMFNGEKAKKSVTPNKAWPGKTKARLGQSKKARPVSAIVNFRYNQHNVSNFFLVKKAFCFYTIYLSNSALKNTLLTVQTNFYGSMMLRFE